MKKADKQRALSEIQALTHITLSQQQLKVIRKLNGSTRVPGHQTIYSPRTIEAILQGRRRDPDLLHAAILNAKKELLVLNETMKQIDDLLCSNITT